MKINIFNREICACALLDTNSLCAKSSAEMEEKMMKWKRIAAVGAAVMMAAGTLAGCGGGTEDVGEGGIVNLKWVTIGNGMPKNYDSWIAKVNEYIGPEIGVNLEMEVIPWGDWDKRRSIIVSCRNLVAFDG